MLPVNVKREKLRLNFLFPFNLTKKKKKGNVVVD